MLKITLTIAAMTLATTVSAADTPISGTVESKCSIFTDIQGVYGNPNPYELSTTPADGGKQPIIRYDVHITHAGNNSSGETWRAAKYCSVEYRQTVASSVWFCL